MLRIKQLFVGDAVFLESFDQSFDFSLVLAVADDLAVFQRALGNVLFASRNDFAVDVHRSDRRR